jgi:kumamolisin
MSHIQEISALNQTIVQQIVAPKTESVPPKVEAPKPIEVKKEVVAPKTESVPPKVEVPKPIEVKKEVVAPKTESVPPKVEVPKPIEVKKEVVAPKTESVPPKVEVPEPIEVKKEVVAPKTETVPPKVEVPKPIEVKKEVVAPKTETVLPKVEAPKPIEVQKEVVPTKTESVLPKVEVPKAVEVKKEVVPTKTEPVLPKVEVPKAVEVKKEVVPTKTEPVLPKVEVPKAVEVKKEVVPTKTETVLPKVEVPKAVEVKKEVVTTKTESVLPKVEVPKAVEVKKEVVPTKTESVPLKVEVPNAPESKQTNHSLSSSSSSSDKEEKYIRELSGSVVLKTTWVLKPFTSNPRVLLLKNMCSKNGLTWVMDGNRVQVEGTVNSFSSVLGCKIMEYGFPQTSTRYYRAENLVLPTSVMHIFGLTNFPHLQHTNFYKPRADIQPHTSFSVLQLADVYQFPVASGATQKIGIIELGGGYVLSDVTTFLANLGINQTVDIAAVSVDGATNNPGVDANSDVEVTLDLEIIAGLCPAAVIRVYFAPNTDTGFFNAINIAGVIDECDIISISWGGAESTWSPTSLASFNTLFQTLANAGKTTVFAASGDNGSSDGQPGNNLDFPSSSPYVVSCGGTTLTLNGNTIESEVVWNNNPTTSATGGGLSAVFACPNYQSDNSSYPFNGRRGSPDMAANANPNTGYDIYIAAQGGSLTIGGTSAVSPLLSAMFARMNQILKADSKPNVGFIHPIVYTATTTAFNDILVGNNGAFTAVQEWDACSGNGSPIGTKILALFASPGSPIAKFSEVPSSGETPLTVQFTDTSTGTPTSWLWDFGDGTAQQTAQNPIHEFTNTVVGTAKEFSVSLTVTNANGSSSVGGIVTVNNQLPSDTLQWWAWLLIAIAIAAVVLIVVYLVWQSGSFNTNTNYRSYKIR